MDTMDWIDDDGGRMEAGYAGETRDCVTRSVAIATGKSYVEVYTELNEMIRATHGSLAKASARLGVPQDITRTYLADLGWKWTATMGIGTGCTVHARAEELPGGVVILRMSKHISVMVDGVIHDTFDPTRNGTRCVYGYWTLDVGAVEE